MKKILLLLLMCVVSAHAGNTINGIPASDPLHVSLISGGTSSALTYTVSTVTTSGTVATGARGLSMQFSPDFTGSLIATGTITLSGTATQAINFPIQAGFTMPAVPYTISAGSIQIILLR